MRVGDIVEVSLPRNHFPLAEDAERHLLIAGGIGITPIMAMIAELKRRRADFRLHYCTRSPETDRVPRRARPARGAGAGVVSTTMAATRAKGLDIAALLREPQPGTHLYYCGPRRDDGGGGARPRRIGRRARVHCEYFTGPGAAPPARSTTTGRFACGSPRAAANTRSPAGETIIGVLRRHGVAIRTSCELGYCGACLTAYLAGEPDHRDQILGGKDRERYMLICCSRAKSAVLELDL